MLLTGKIDHNEFHGILDRSAQYVADYTQNKL